MKKHIPNFITSLNLLAGCMAVYYAFQADYFSSFRLVLLAAVFDFFDGFAARLLRAYSPMGKELDSLADIVSFGLVPGVIAFSLLREAGSSIFLSFVAFVIPIFSALRLAKFNIDERQTSSFIGLPTPANALFWIGISVSFESFLVAHPWLVILLAFIFSILLVAEIPMFSLKFKNILWSENKTQFLFLAGCVLLLVLLQINALAAIVAWYIVISIANNIRLIK
ncbi:MAG: CDP-diacylglycerol--serine O-phosphatidyltransferase [Porphyromonadaceae bacterium CG2_30_38_12]|nr:MAG: CDP-diacylglycerol--serine O-phosphatidyltransferase [Porphyromonadaceae bacterium CG2_30_38_12]